AATTATPNKSACLILMGFLSFGPSLGSSELCRQALLSREAFYYQASGPSGLRVPHATMGRVKGAVSCPNPGALAMRVIDNQTDHGIGCATARSSTRSTSARPQDLAHQDGGLFLWKLADLAHEDRRNHAIAGVVCFRHFLGFEQRPIRIGDATRAHLRVHLLPQRFDRALVDRRALGCGLHRPLVESELLLQQRLGQLTGETGPRI